MNKSFNQRIHAKKRALERYGLKLNQELYEELSARARRAPVHLRQSNRTTIRIIYYEGEFLKVVYDSHRHQIVSFLPYYERKH